jgi:CRISPR/Cas system-associated exonuclease Cas4 (RecB family)
MFIMALIITVIVILMLSLRRQRKKAKVNRWIISQDLDGQSSRIYRDTKNKISSKPDIAYAGKVVEFKNREAGKTAWHADQLQVIVSMMTKGAKEGELRYRNGKIFYFHRDEPETKRLMAEATRIINEMKSRLSVRSTPKATPTEWRCKVCTFRNKCPESRINHYRGYAQQKSSNSHTPNRNLNERVH